MVRTALPAMHPSSRGVACVFTPTTPTAASTAADLEIAEEQPPLRSKRRRTLRSVVRGSGVLVSPLRSLVGACIQCPCESFTHDYRRRYVRSERANLFPAWRDGGPRRGRRESADFAKITRGWLCVCLCVCMCVRTRACLCGCMCVCTRARVCPCGGNISIVIVCVYVRADLWWFVGDLKRAIAPSRQRKLRIRSKTRSPMVAARKPRWNPIDDRRRINFSRQILDL